MHVFRGLYMIPKFDPKGFRFTELLLNVVPLQALVPVVIGGRVVSFENAGVLKVDHWAMVTVL